MILQVSPEGYHFIERTYPKKVDGNVRERTFLFGVGLPFYTSNNVFVSTFELHYSLPTLVQRHIVFQVDVPLLLEPGKPPPRDPIQTLFTLRLLFGKDGSTSCQRSL